MDIMNTGLASILPLSFTTSQLSWLMASSISDNEYTTWNTGLNIVSLPNMIFSVSQSNVTPVISTRYSHLTLSIFFQL